LGPDRHCVCYPVSAGRLISFGATSPADGWRTESWSATGSVVDLAEAYSGWHDEVQQIVGAIDTVGRWALHDRDTLEQWSTDRVTVVGDAAHPMLPFMAQGANQAIEDAVVLAGCLRWAAADGVGPSLRRYEALRKARIAQVHQMSRDNSKLFHLPDGEEQQGRDADLGGPSALRRQEWLYDYDAELVSAR
jgi:salicylate hydroxylase